MNGGENMTSRTILSRTHEDIDKFTRNVFNRFRYSGITHVLGVARGGLVPATMVAYYFDLPLTITFYSSPAGRGMMPTKELHIHAPDCDKAPNPEDLCMLIIDDISDTGNTLCQLVKALEGHGVKTYTATIDLRAKSDFIPDYFHNVITDEIVKYPWNLDAPESA